MNSALEVELVKQVFELIKVMIWPLALILIALRFRVGLSRFLGDLTNIAFEAFGIKFSAQRAAAIVAEISTAEFAKQADQAKQENREPTKVAPGTSIPRSLEKIMSSPRARTFADKSILWVDDRPQGNQHEAEALRKLGISIRQVVSTEEAIDTMQSKTFDLIITDLKRGDDSDAGYAFIVQVLKKTPSQKILVYTGYTSQSRQDQAKKLGAAAVTSSPRDLFDLVVDNIGS